MNWKLICQDVRYDEPMSRHTSFRIGGTADVFLRPNTRDELLRILEIEPNAHLIGNGSNLLVSDSGVRGAVVSTTALRTVERLSATAISCECGTLLSQAASYAWKLGLSGLEFAAGIPGTVGGALYMNAGAYGGEISGVLCSSECLDGGKVSTLSDHGFGYRDSVFRRKRGLVALSAVFELEADNFESIQERMDDYALRRKSKQPLEWPSAGSVFKRPEGGFAGALIEETGLKGLTFGGAQVSEKHAGFIINRADATCEDVLRLIEKIQTEVRNRFGVELEPEIRTLGI